MIWENQGVSEEIEKLWASWGPGIHQALVESAGKHNVTDGVRKTIAGMSSRNSNCQRAFFSTMELGAAAPEPSGAAPEAQEDSDRTMLQNPGKGLDSDGRLGRIQSWCPGARDKSQGCSFKNRPPTYRRRCRPTRRAGRADCLQTTAFHSSRRPPPPLYLFMTGLSA